MTNREPRELSLAGKLVVGLLAGGMMLVTGIGFAVRDPLMIGVGAMAVATLFWTVGAAEPVRQRTTDLLSKSQILAIVLGLAVAQGTVRFVWLGDLSPIEVVGLIGLVLWFGWTLLTEGWSKRT